MNNRKVLVLDFATVESRALAMQLADMAKGRVELANIPDPWPGAYSAGMQKMEKSPTTNQPINRHARRRAAKLSKKHGI